MRVVGIFFCILLLIVCGWVVRSCTIAERAAFGVAERVANPDNIIYNYEWFHQQYADYQSYKSRLEQAESDLASFLESAGNRDTWKREDRAEYNRLTSYKSALQAQLTTIVNTYNAHAEMSTRSIFLGTDLPDHLK